MDSFEESMSAYRKQLEKGAIQRAFRGLMDYVIGVRSYFEKKYHEYSVSESSILGLWI